MSMTWDDLEKADTAVDSIDRIGLFLLLEDENAKETLEQKFIT